MNIVVLDHPKDSDLVNNLLEHFNLLEKNKLVNLWCSDEIVPGEEYLSNRIEAIKSANIIILCVSKNYLNGKHCNSDCEAINHAKLIKTNMLVFPVLLSPCMWEVIPLECEFEVLPENKVPLTSKEWSSIDLPITQIVYFIKGIITSDSGNNKSIIRRIAGVVKKRNLIEKKENFIHGNSNIKGKVNSEFKKFKEIILKGFEEIEVNSNVEIDKEELDDRSFIFSCLGFSMLILFSSNFSYYHSISDDHILMKISDKPLSSIRRRKLNVENLKILLENVYKVDANANLELGWSDEDNNYIDSASLAKHIIDLFFDVVLSSKEKLLNE